MKKTLRFAILLSLLFAKTFGQSHLKAIQVTSVWAPANAKVDGKLNEWEDNFQAYNKSTKLFYTISNNDKYLFLAITTTEAENDTKIAAGGITFTINTAGKKKDKDAFILTYPVINRASRGGRGGGRMGGGRSQTGVPDTAIANAAHRQLISSSKEIKVFGFKDVDDTLISIYNEYGIKTAIGYDSLGNYGYELAIPLKLMGISAENASEIAYNIKVNGLQLGMNSGFKSVNLAGGGGAGGGGFGGGGGGGRGGAGGGRGGSTGEGGRPGGTNYEDLTSPGDFWGKYTLAKK